MRLIFAGTPEFAACALQSLIEAGHEVVLVLTQPDRAGGRGMKLLMSPVKQVALSAGLTVLQPPSLKDPAVQTVLRDYDPEVMVVAAYGLILPQAVLDIPALGAINIHASLLPRWRGAAPIQRALLAGDRQTGITIMAMEAGLDTGPILSQEACDIESRDTSQSLHDRLAAMGAGMVVQALETLRSTHPRAQPETGVTYAHKLTKAEARIDWHSPAEVIERSIRAYFPFPGAYSRLKGTELKLWEASALASGTPSEHLPGEVISAEARAISVACGQGILELIELQRPGGKKLAASEFLRGFAIVPGDRFESE
jgi:methionyl-tRNA formyltransferase